jgi:hypothetical protein
VGSNPTLSARICAVAIAAAFVLSASRARSNDADQELGEAPPEEPPADPSEPAELGFDGPYAIELGVVLGIGGRLDDPPLYPASERVGLAIGGGASLFVSRRLAFGLGYEHLGLGAEDSGVTESGTVVISHRLDTAWADLRVYPLWSEAAAAYLRVGVGAAFQSASLAGTFWSPFMPARRVEVECSGGPSPGIGLRAEIGGDFAFGDVHLTTGAGIDLYRLDDGLIGDCAPGSGTATVLGGRTALVYRWSL